MLGPMVNAPAPATPAHSGGAGALHSGFASLLRLSAAVTATGYSARRFRSLRMTGIFLGLSGVISVLAVARLGAADVGDIVALRVLAYSCWLFGGLGIFALLSPDALSEQPSELAQMRGQNLDTPIVRTAGFARRLVLGMLVASLPGLLTALIVSPTMGAVAHRAALLVVATLYLTSLGIILSAVGVLSSIAAPRAPRTFALLLVIGPFLLSLVAEEIPSIIGIYSWGFRQMIEWGALS